MSEGKIPFTLWMNMFFIRNNNKANNIEPRTVYDLVLENTIFFRIQELYLISECIFLFLISFSLLAGLFRAKIMSVKDLWHKIALCECYTLLIKT